MKYIIDKNNNDLKLMYYNVNMVGLNVIPKNDVPGLSIKANKVVIIDKDLTDSYIKQRINKKIDKIIKFMLKILNDDGTTEDLNECWGISQDIYDKIEDYIDELEKGKIFEDLSIDCASN